MVELRTYRFTVPSADQTIDLGNFCKTKKKRSPNPFICNNLSICMIFSSWNLAFGVSCVPSTGYIHDRYVMQMFNYLSRNLTIEFDCICTFPIQVNMYLCSTHTLHTITTHRLIFTRHLLSF